MDRERAELVTWFKAVSKHWKGELLGGVLIGAIALFSELSGVEVRPAIYLLAASLVLFYAMFLAWRDSYRTCEGESLKAMIAVAELESRKLHPALTFAVAGMAFRSVHEKQIEIRVDLLILNAGVQTSLHTWQATVRLKSGRSISCTSGFFNKNEKEFEGRPNLVLDSGLIRRGDKREGWVKFLLMNDSPMLPLDIAFVALGCRDAFEDFYKIEGPDFGSVNPLPHSV
jgi:hypothetical protein